MDAVAVDQAETLDRKLAAVSHDGRGHSLPTTQAGGANCTEDAVGRVPAVPESSGRQAIPRPWCGRSPRPPATIDGRPAAVSVQHVEIADGEVRIMGAKSNLPGMLTAASGAETSRFRRWRFCAEVASRTGYATAQRYQTHTSPIGVVL